MERYIRSFGELKEKEKNDKRLLSIELVIGFVSVGVMLALCIFAAYAPMADWIRGVLIGIGFLPVLILIPFMIRIEQTAGYYKCEKCGHAYVPKYKSVFLSMHAGRTRYMKCPNCNEKSWQKKVISKD